MSFVISIQEMAVKILSVAAIGIGVHLLWKWGKHQRIFGFLPRSSSLSTEQQHQQEEEEGIEVCCLDTRSFDDHNDHTTPICVQTPLLPDQIESPTPTAAEVETTHSHSSEPHTSVTPHRSEGTQIDQGLLVSPLSSVDLFPPRLPQHQQQNDEKTNPYLDEEYRVRLSIVTVHLPSAHSHSHLSCLVWVQELSFAPFAAGPLPSISTSLSRRQVDDTHGEIMTTSAKEQEEDESEVEDVTFSPHLPPPTSPPTLQPSPISKGTVSAADVFATALLHEKEEEGEEGKGREFETAGQTMTSEHVDFSIPLFSHFQPPQPSTQHPLSPRQQQQQHQQQLSPFTTSLPPPLPSDATNATNENDQHTYNLNNHLSINNNAVKIERSYTLHSTASDRRLPRVDEDASDNDLSPSLSPSAAMASATMASGPFGAANTKKHVTFFNDRTAAAAAAAGAAAAAASTTPTPMGVRADQLQLQDPALITAEAELALQLDIIAGPSAQSTNLRKPFTTATAAVITIGRAPAHTSNNAVVIPNDGEVSGRHAQISWSSMQRCWQLTDIGSLNGTLLNNEPITAGEHYRLCTDDIVQLGTSTKLKVSVFPREMLPENQPERSLSLSMGPGSSLPRSLTMPKHRIPSFSSLLTPKINSPSKQAVVAAASDELRLECCIASATGRDHARKGQMCEDIALAECPLHGSDLALGPLAPAALFLMFDGHCGRGAAEAAAEVLPDEVSDRLRHPGVAQGLVSGNEEVVKQLMREAFLSTDDRINSEEGCTATAVLAWRGPHNAVALQAANVGDSAAILIDPDTGTWTVLTDDHRLTNPAERDRLAQTGIPINSDSRRLYGLNLARALGDKFLKDEDLGLSAEPAVSGMHYVAAHQGALLLVASDGLWDVMDYEKVAAVATRADREQDGSVVEIAAEMVAAAKKAGTRDDVTALVVRLWPEDDWALRSPLMTLDDGQAASFVAP